jgi:hypothetical protein
LIEKSVTHNILKSPRRVQHLTANDENQNKVIKDIHKHVYDFFVGLQEKGQKPSLLYMVPGERWIGERSRDREITVNLSTRMLMMPMSTPCVRLGGARGWRWPIESASAGLFLQSF